jgi:hypothetical protein
MKKYIILFCFSFLTVCTFGQSKIKTHNASSWTVLSTDMRFNHNIGVHFDAQLRLSDFVTTMQQVFIRPGLNFYLNDKMFFNVSYLYLETFPYGKFPAKTKYPEHAIWESFNVKSKHKMFEWITRFQLEQRFIKVPIAKDSLNYIVGDAVFSNRLRILNRLSIPFKGQDIVDNSFYFTVFDELFINFGKNVSKNLFDQNRTFIGVGYKIPKLGRLEVGYMAQTILKADAIKMENNHILQIALFSNLDFRKKKE